MSTIAEVFGALEVAVLLVGLLVILFAQEMAKLMGFAVIARGTVMVAVLFLAVSFFHDHVHVSIGGH